MDQIKPGPTQVAEPTTESDVPPPPKKAKTLKIWQSHDARVEKVQKTSLMPVIKPNIEMSKYERETVLERDQDPLMWRATEGSLMPELQKLAKKYLCCLVKGTPSESFQKLAN